MRKRTARNGQVSEPYAFQALGMDPYLSDIDDLRRGVRRLAPATRRRLLLATAAALHGADTRRSEPVRVGAVKVLVALYPHSGEFLRTWLRRFDTHAFEVHFSMFCFLDGIERGRR